VALGNPDLPDNMALYYYLSQAGTEVAAEAQFEDDQRYIPQSSTDHTEVEHLVMVEHQSARFLQLSSERWLLWKNPFQVHSKPLKKLKLTRAGKVTNKLTIFITLKMPERNENYIAKRNIASKL